MVRFIVTPWSSPHELLDVRRQFYAGRAAAAPGEDGGGKTTRPSRRSADADADADASPGTREAAAEARRKRQLAVARVEMWVRRGNCPHMVESTALLTAALLLDERLHAAPGGEVPAFALRTAYSTAFSR